MKMESFMIEEETLRSYITDESMSRTQGVHVDYRARNARLTHRNRCRLRMKVYALMISVRGRSRPTTMRPNRMLGQSVCSNAVWMARIGLVEPRGGRYTTRLRGSWTCGLQKGAEQPELSNRLGV